jgi:hypothetical protein
MTLGNMRAQGVRSLSVSRWHCHHGAEISAEPWSDDCLRAVVWSADGLHTLRDRRRRCAAKLAGPTRAPSLTGEHWR